MLFNERVAIIVRQKVGLEANNGFVGGILLQKLLGAFQITGNHGHANLVHVLPIILQQCGYGAHFLVKRTVLIAANSVLYLIDADGQHLEVARRGRKPYLADIIAVFLESCCNFLVLCIILAGAERSLIGLKALACSFFLLVHVGPLLLQGVEGLHIPFVCFLIFRNTLVALAHDFKLIQTCYLAAAFPFLHVELHGSVGGLTIAHVLGALVCGDFIETEVCCAGLVELILQTGHFQGALVHVLQL